MNTSQRTPAQGAEGGAGPRGRAPPLPGPEVGVGWRNSWLAVKTLHVVSRNINGIRIPLQRVLHEEPHNCTAVATARTWD